MRSNKEEDRCCAGHRPAVASVCQTLEEMEFERGIWTAAVDGDLPRVSALLEKTGGGAADLEDKSGYTALHYAARAGHLAVCRKLVASGACVNKKTRAGGATPLHRAAMAGVSGTVQLLLGWGGDALSQDVDGRVPLHRAVQSGDLETVSVLVEAAPGAAQVEDRHGKTPPDYAADNAQMQHLFSNTKHSK